MIYCLISFS